jgi:hypothetical protein
VRLGLADMSLHSGGQPSVEPWSAVSPFSARDYSGLYLREASGTDSLATPNFAADRVKAALSRTVDLLTRAETAIAAGGKPVDSLSLDIASGELIEAA